MAMEGSGAWCPGGLRTSRVASRKYRARFLSPAAHWARQARRQGALQASLEVWVSSSFQAGMKPPEHQASLLLSEVEAVLGQRLLRLLPTLPEAHHWAAPWNVLNEVVGRKFGAGSCCSQIHLRDRDPEGPFLCPFLSLPFPSPR